MILVAFVSEMWGVLTGRTDETISNVAWTLAGDRYGPRWWVVVPVIEALLAWFALHLPFGGETWGWKQLLVFLLLFLAGAQLFRIIAP